MSYSLEEIAGVLKSARQKKQLSQRDLSEKVGMPQSHISKIENAAVDLKVSSLTELARALELELVFVPRKALPAVQSLIRTSRDYKDIVKATSGAGLRVLGRLQKSAEQLQKLQPNLAALRQIQRTAEALKPFRLPDTSLKNLKQVASQMDKFRKTWEKLEPYTLDQATVRSIQHIDNELSDLRNRAAHSVTVPSVPETRTVPAYQLTTDDDDG